MFEKIRSFVSIVLPEIKVMIMIKKRAKLFVKRVSLTLLTACSILVLAFLLLSGGGLQVLAEGTYAHLLCQS
jgi:hypothetical protein